MTRLRLAVMSTALLVATAAAAAEAPRRLALPDVELDDRGRASFGRSESRQVAPCPFDRFHATADRRHALTDVEHHDADRRPLLGLGHRRLLPG